MVWMMKVFCPQQLPRNTQFQLVAGSSGSFSELDIRMGILLYDMLSKI